MCCTALLAILEPASTTANLLSRKSRRDGASARSRRTPILKTMFGGVNCRVRVLAHVTVPRGVLSMARFFARRLGPA